MKRKSFYLSHKIFVNRILFPPYERDHDTPGYWQKDQSGQLQRVMELFLTGQLKPQSEDYQLFKAYLIYAIEAPCWQIPEFQMEKISAIQQADSIEDIEQFLESCLQIDIDLL